MFHYGEVLFFSLFIQRCEGNPQRNLPRNLPRILRGSVKEYAKEPKNKKPTVVAEGPVPFVFYSGEVPFLCLFVQR